MHACSPVFQGSISVPNPLKPLVSIRNHACRTVLLEFKVVFSLLNLLEQLLVTRDHVRRPVLLELVSPKPTQTTSISEESSP